MNIGYVAVERFIPSSSYYEWSKLYHVKEIVSLDTCLCSRVFDFSERDIDKIVWMKNDSYWTYKDLDWLIQKIGHRNDIQILAVAREPEEEFSKELFDERFQFFGFDLMEDMTDISALTNCGGFDNAFHPDDISQYGLIEDFGKAKEIQQKLMIEYPDESHADCSVWAIWKMKSK